MNLQPFSLGVPSGPSTYAAKLDSKSMTPAEQLRQFNEVWDGRRLYTACIEFMFWYELNENIDASGQGMPEVEKSYRVMVEAMRSRINYFSKEESVRRSKPKRDTLELFPYSLRNTRHNELGAINQITLLNGSAEKYGSDDESDIFVDAHLTEFCYQRFGLSIEEVLADPQAYVQRCIDAVAGVKFKSGIGGYSFNYEDVYINGNEQLQDPVMARFKGVNVLHAWRYRKFHGVPTVNWLTLVNNDDIERLGGWEALAARVSEPVILHKLPQGAMLQAGREPLLGDVNRQERLDAYHAAPGPGEIDDRGSVQGRRRPRRSHRLDASLLLSRRQRRLNPWSRIVCIKRLPYESSSLFHRRASALRPVDGRRHRHPVRAGGR
ncbi:MAG: DUF3396 domain-containing protein [Rubrivivax sp.]|nr:MAG: DUF3396 domain-containing protein [Rubrivivax sp.]